MPATTRDDFPQWTTLHDLGLIYLALTHGADEDLDESETSAMADKLNTWNQDLSDDRIRKLMHEVMLVYMGGASEQMIEAAIASVGNAMNKPRRIAVLNDLADIASADGSIVMGEVSFIQQLAREWDVERDIR